MSLDEVWLTLNGNVIGHNNRHRHSGSQHAVLHLVFSHDLEVGVWCAVSASKTTGPVFFKETPSKLNIHGSVHRSMNR
jgi:hypothetical protein